ncbi:MAG: amidase [Solirubrobacteraceae bacterium]|jgi:amidase|nr:amidase [Solirubrobacteraceae bacterium]
MDAAELAFTGVVRQAELVRAGEVAPRELVETYLERIDRLDPRLNAFRSVYRERAVAEADQAAARLKAGDERPLLGVPVAIKDNTDVAGDVTTHGTNAYGEAAREDAEVVRRVRAAGAIVLGRTHVPPLCALPCTESPTWGITRNPWDVNRTPGGSSGGSGAAVAAGLVGAALGTDGAGSIRFPAAHNGLFGLKPQRGRISLAPLPEHWHGMSVVGWLTRGVADAALMYDATMGNVPSDREPTPPPERSFAEAATSAPGKLRVAYSLRPPPGTIGAGPDADVRRALLETAELLRSLGHEVHEQDLDIPLDAVSHGVVRTVRGIADEARTLPHYERLDRRFRRVTRLGELIPAAALARALAAESGVAERVNRIFDDHDVVLTPVAPEPPFEVGRWEGRGMLWTLNGGARMIAFTALWNQTGQPAAAVPAGSTAGGLPLSVQLVGRPNDEGTLLSLAAQLEAERPWADRRPPVS